MESNNDRNFDFSEFTYAEESVTLDRSAVGSFDFCEFEQYSPLVDNQLKTFEEERQKSFLQVLEGLHNNLKDATNAMIYHLYENFLANKPRHLHPPKLEDVLLNPCCGNYCGMNFTPESIMRSRLLIPLSFSNDESAYSVVLDFHFTLLKLCINGTSLAPKIGNIPVCAEFFRRVYAIPFGRYNRLSNQVLMNFTRPLPHANEGRCRTTVSTLERIGTLVNILATVAEPMPDGKGYILPSSLSKTELVAQTNVKNIKLDTKQELGKISTSLHFQKSNSFTKCSTCLTIRLGLHQNRFSPECVEAAKHFLKQHLESIKLEKQDYYVRMQHSRTSNELLSIAHDGMSKEKTKFPHLLEDRSKKITDTMKMMNSLCLGIAHKTSSSLAGDQLHAFWNIDQISGGTSNTIISQLFNMISNCNPIPAEISIQLDNCAANKNYNTLGAFGLLLLWVPKITKIYLCMPQVGHTHDDVDRHFSTLARVLRKKQVYSPFGYSRLFDETFKNVVSNNLLPTTYDFFSITDPVINKFKEVNANHFFELSRDADSNVIVRIGRYVRSETFLKVGKSNSSYFNLFKTTPDTTKHPKIVPPNAMNKKGFEDLCNVLEKLMPTEDFLELQNLPNFIAENKNQESFEQLLERISARMVTEAPNRRSMDFHDIEIDEFLKNPKIWRTWQPPSEEEIQSFSSQLLVTETSLDGTATESTSPPSQQITKAKRKKKNSIDPVPVQNQNQPPLKRPRGRPRNA